MGSIFVPAANCVVTTFLMELDGVPVSIMPTYRKLSGSINIFNLTTFNSAIDALFVAQVLPLLSSDISYLLTQSRRQNVISDIAASTAANAGEVGEGDLALPSGCAFRMEVVTVTEGRPGRGAVYVPGIPRDQVTLNTVDEEWAQDLVTAFYNIQVGAVAAGWELVVRSKFLNNVARPSCLVTTSTGIAHFNNVIDYQRRRKPDAGITDGDTPLEVLALA